MEAHEIPFAQKAIELSRKCQAEPGKNSPLVGAVVVKDGKEIAATYRGARNPGEHAEFLALEKELKDEVIAGATVYTTLEPCTVRNDPRHTDWAIRRDLDALDPTRAERARRERAHREPA